MGFLVCCFGNHSNLLSAIRPLSAHFALFSSYSSTLCESAARRTPLHQQRPPVNTIWQNHHQSSFPFLDTRWGPKQNCKKHHDRHQRVKREKKLSQSAGFELTLTKGIWFQVGRLNHSATTASDIAKIQRTCTESKISKYSKSLKRKILGNLEEYTRN